jgi:hypothetical protein
MKSRGQRHKQVTRRIRRDRRRLGRFVVFAEMLADLRPISLLDQTAPARKLDQTGALRDRGQSNP